MCFDRKRIKADFHEMIAPLCEAVAPTGFEEEAAQVVRGYLENTGVTLTRDHMQNLIVHKAGAGPKVMVTAHLDEIGLIIRYIDKLGFLWFETLSGVLPQQLFGRPVIVKTETGYVNGIANNLAPGRPERCTDMPTKMDEFFVDVGASSREEALEMGIEVGNPVSLQYPTVFLGRDGSSVAGKALDDRVCVFMLIELCRLLTDESGGPDLYAVFTTQEETGARGAVVAAQNIQPKIALALDMSLATDIPVFPDRKTVNVLGGGASIKIMDKLSSGMIGVIADRGIVRDMKAIAAKYGIPYQFEVYTAGATDASLIQTQAGGIRCGGIQIPMRYVHAYEMARVDDILSSTELLYRYVKSLSQPSPERVYR